MDARISKPKNSEQSNVIKRHLPVARRSAQERLLPIMTSLLVILAFFFFASSFWQLYYINQSILQMPTIDIKPASAATLMANARTFDDALRARQVEIESNMEVFIVTQRYHQVGVLMMSGLWVRYLGFITGMILSIVGASFVLGRLREPVQKLDGSFSAVNLSLRTTSPGIILVVLGVMLMFTTLIDKDTYSVNDRNTYLGSVVPMVTETTTPLTPNLTPPDQIELTPQP